MNDPLHADMVAALAEAVDKAGSQSEFARATGARQQNVSNWLKTGKALPGEFVLKAEEHYGISRHRFRPDIFGAAIQPPRPGTLVMVDLPRSCDRLHFSQAVPR